MLNRRRAYSMRASRAFTLVELLMTIGVIGILAALVLSALSRARAATQAITCLNNLQQWGNATHLYALDNNDLLPPEGKATPSDNDLNRTGYRAWYVQLPEQMNLPRYRDMPWRTNSSIQPDPSIWICPANSRRCHASNTTTNLFHYCLNHLVNGTGDENHQTPITAIRYPVQVVWLFDNGGLAAFAQQNNVHSNLHSRGAQFLFIDGHAARFRRQEYWDSKHNKGITNNPALVWIP
jgi:prepilin-type N-terminal cleavage/methylation domain-containing protein/prepilin-type processing-associated H-X9-DG protein